MTGENGEIIVPPDSKVTFNFEMLQSVTQWGENVQVSQDVPIPQH